MNGNNLTFSLTECEVFKIEKWKKPKKNFK